MVTYKRFLALGAAAAMLLALAGTASAVTNWATVTGYADASSDSNDPNWWEKNPPEGMTLTDCTKVDGGEGDGAFKTYLLEHDYALVVVKAGSKESTDYSLTLFANAKAGETVWADSNGSGAFDSTPSPADKDISHIILCDSSDSEPTPTPTTPASTPSPTPTFGQSFAGETDTPTEPSTDALGGTGTSGPADGAWLLVVALGVLLASIVVLTPARAKGRR